MDTDEPHSPTAEGFEIPIQPATEQEEANAATQSSGKKQGGRSNQSVKGRAKGRGRAQPAAKISTAEGTVGTSAISTGSRQRAMLWSVYWASASCSSPARTRLEQSRLGVHCQAGSALTGAESTYVTTLITDSSRRS